MLRHSNGHTLSLRGGEEGREEEGRGEEGVSQEEHTESIRGAWTNPKQ
jgi:hypothetical protein